MIDTIKEKKSVAGETIPEDWLIVGGWNDHSFDHSDLFWKTVIGNRNSQGRRAPRLWEKVCIKACNDKAARGDLKIAENIKVRIFTGYERVSRKGLLCYLQKKPGAI